jgi:hypothetical protein
LAISPTNREYRTTIRNRSRARADIVLDPLAYRPRTNKRKAGRLLGEHQRRVGDPNRGSTSKVPMMTAYRQEALRCAELMAGHGPMKPAAMRAAADVPNAAKILRPRLLWLVRAGRARCLCPQPGRPARAREFRAAG